VVALALTPATYAQKHGGPGVAITELKIGKVIAYSGPSSLSIALPLPVPAMASRQRATVVREAGIRNGSALPLSGGSWRQGVRENSEPSEGGMTMGKIILTIFSLACLLGTATVPLAADPGTEDPNNWPQYHRTSNAWRYSPLDQINKDNVSKLSVAWIAHGGDITMGIQETPLAIDGVIYSITAGNRVAALDGRTGQKLWSYQPKLDPLTKKVLFSPYSRGVAVGHGMVFIGTVDGRGIALDQKTGKEIWQVQLTDFANCHGCNFTSPPVVAGDILTFGSTAGELATQGKIYGVEAKSGQKLWEFNTIKNDPRSWPGESGKYGGGGAWMPGTYDAETDTIFYGTGNPGKDFIDADRQGDNLYTDSVVALDPKTGRLKWYRQEIKQDVWDYDSPYEVMLFKKDGKDLIVHLNKSGYVFVLDKHDGNIENIWPLSDVINFVQGIDKKTGELIGRVQLPMNQETLICPSTMGARSWNSGAYNPKTGLWYNNVLDFCGYLKPVAQKADPKDYGTAHIGANDFGRLVLAPDGRKPGRLDARDPFTGERKWTYEMDIPGFASVLTTGGGLVFNGDPLGMLRAFDADIGKVLWSFNTGSGMRSGIISYAVDGEQYILVPSGWGSYAAILLPALFPQLEKVPAASTLIAFKLPR
jgi:alcohol dehydrogenase (cytochrome c)